MEDAINRVNLDPDSYDTNEILYIFNLKSIDTLTQEIINKQFSQLVSKYNLTSDNVFYTFLQTLKDKLITYIIKNNKVNTVPYQTPGREELLNNPQVIQNNDSYVIKPGTFEPYETFDNKYPNDVLNPIRTKTTTHIVAIDTLFRNPIYNTNDFVYTLNDTLKNVVSLKVTSFELPNVWYSFSNENKSNVFYIDMSGVNDGSGNFYSASYDIIIPPGNYAPIEFQDKMNTLFTNLAPNQGPDFLTLRIDQHTGKTIIRANDINDIDLGTSPVPFDPLSAYYSPNLEYTLRFAVENIPERPLYFNAGWMMGFRKESYTVTGLDTYIDVINTIPPITYVGYIESESYFGSNIFTYIYFEIDDFNNNSASTNVTTNNEYMFTKNIIAKIPLTSGSNTIIINTSDDQMFKERNYFGPINIDKFRVRLLNKFGQPIAINNNDYSFSLEVTQIYS